MFTSILIAFMVLAVLAFLSPWVLIAFPWVLLNFGFWVSAINNAQTHDDFERANAATGVALLLSIIGLMGLGGICYTFDYFW